MSVEGKAPEELEAWYDKHVAPLLLKIGGQCADRGISFLAVVGYDGAKGSSGRTFCAPPHRPEFFNVMDTAARCHLEGGGFHLDAFLGAMIRNAREHGHSSAYLRQLGVAEKPESPADPEESYDMDDLEGDEWMWGYNGDELR